MIPYFQIDAIALGPITIQAWGTMVALGIALGLLVSYHLARKNFLSPNVVLDVAVWAIIGALISARLFYILFYSPEYYLLHPGDIIKIWQGGASSLGGFVGAALAIWIFAKIRHFTWKEFLPYLDVGAVGLWLGWGVGRIGCFLIHDHPGRLTNFPLAVNFPDGARLDLGLMDSLLGFLLFILSLTLYKKLSKRRAGLLFGISLALYALVRFFLDFLRATDLLGSDRRYLHLTPAQWGMLATLVILTFMLFWGKMQRAQRQES